MKILNSKIFWVVFSLVCLGAIVLALPKGFNMNLDEIGNGSKSIVFVYDLNFSVSNRQTEQMNEARSYLGDKANFLIAKVGDPRGDDFKARYNASTAELFIFDEEGKLIDRKIALVPADYLIKKILDN